MEATLQTNLIEVYLSLSFISAYTVLEWANFFLTVPYQHIADTSYKQTNLITFEYKSGMSVHVLCVCVCG